MSDAKSHPTPSMKMFSRTRNDGSDEKVIMFGVN
jgi:hypothetical protein